MNSIAAVDMQTAPQLLYGLDFFMCRLKEYAGGGAVRKRRKKRKEEEKERTKLALLV